MDLAMKSRGNQNLRNAALGIWWPAGVVSVVTAFYYAVAAHGDEQKGYPYTAALEWRKAAELLCPNTIFAAYCWRQWERIMRLPRQMAIPLGASHLVVFPQNAAFTEQARTKSIDPALIATAA